LLNLAKYEFNIDYSLGLVFGACENPPTTGHCFCKFLDKFL